jgi:hypothetical protein
MKNKEYKHDNYSYILCTLFLILSVNIQSIQFGQATNLSNYEPTISRNPQIAVNNSGQAFAIWEEIKGGEVLKNIYARNYSNDFLGPASNLSGNFYSEYPQIAMDDQGNALAIWLRQTASIVTRRYSNEIWREDSNQNNNSAFNSKPQIDMNNSGTGIAIWQENTAPYIYNIYCRLYTGSWQDSTN